MPVRSGLCEQHGMLSLSQILQVHVMQSEQWAPTGRNINLHPAPTRTNETKSCQSHNAVQKYAVGVLAAFLHLK